MNELRMRKYLARLAPLFIAIVFVAVACAPATKPAVVIESPATGAQVNKDDEVSIKFTATDSSGIAKIELVVDGASVKTDTIQPVGTFAGVQKWKAIVGSHTISIRAYNAAGTASEPATVALNVVQNTPTPQPTATVAATATLTASPTPTRLVSPTPSAKDNLLSSFTAALGKIKAYRAKVILDISRQDSPYRVIDVILPDRFHQTIETDIRQIGGTVYFQEPFPYTANYGGIWYIFQRVHLPWYRDQIQQAKEVTLLGRSVIDGQQLVGYQTTIVLVNTNLSTRDTQPLFSEQPMKVWFSAQNGFPVRIEVGQPLQFINLFYDFNGKIDDIGPP